MCHFETLKCSRLVLVGVMLHAAVQLNTASGAESFGHALNAAGGEEGEYLFAGKCPNGESYRLFSYQVVVHGDAKSFYDYEGPAGRGQVRTNTPPKTMAVRVCRELAEIASDQR